MKQDRQLSSRPRAFLRAVQPDHPILFVAPSMLQATARRFIDGFPGLVTYAVKANHSSVVLENLVAAGIRTFDVASPNEMAAVRRVLPTATLHYNNPVRSSAEVSKAVEFGVASYSVDCQRELLKLTECGVPKSAEVAVRLSLSVPGAAYDFGEKFGADEQQTVSLLRKVSALGYRPALTFHPGTQCEDPNAWVAYIKTAAELVKDAGVTIERMNVGGGFAAHRIGEAPDLNSIFGAIEQAVRQEFPDGERPMILCEPGRAVVADGFSLATRVKAIRADGSVFLNDGIYGALSENPSMGNVDRIEVYGPAGTRSPGFRARVVFGPTCDSLDRLPGHLNLPEDLSEGDWIIFHGMGAYSQATMTGFNGYGDAEVVTVEATV